MVGRQCGQCKEGTFGLALDNPKGCTECFCFGRTTSCQQAGLSWGQRRLTRPRTLHVNDTINDIIVSIVVLRKMISTENSCSCSAKICILCTCNVNLNIRHTYAYHFEKKFIKFKLISFPSISLSLHYITLEITLEIEKLLLLLLKYYQYYNMNRMKK